MFKNFLKNRMNAVEQRTEVLEVRDFFVCMLGIMALGPRCFTDIVQLPVLTFEDQILCTSVQTDIHTSVSALSFILPSQHSSSMGLLVITSMHFSLFKFTLVLNYLLLFWKLLVIVSLLGAQTSFHSVYPVIRNCPPARYAWNMISLEHKMFPLNILL
jgi:hypothetical protein